MRDEAVTLDELIAALEAAREGSCELDAKIAALCHPTDPDWYTTSVDAALTLMPKEGNCWGVDWTPTRKFNHAYVSRNHVKKGHWLFDCYGAATPALALCIAALKARNQT